MKKISILTVTLLLTVIAAQAQQTPEFQSTESGLTLMPTTANLKLGNTPVNGFTPTKSNVKLYSMQSSFNSWGWEYLCSIQAITESNSASNSPLYSGYFKTTNYSSTGDAYGGYFNANSATNSNGKIYGLYSDAYNSNSLAGNIYAGYFHAHSANPYGVVYGIYSSVTGSSVSNGRNTIKFSGYFDGGNVAIMNGKLGIATENPLTPLHINSGINTDAAILATSAEDNKLIVRSLNTQPVNVPVFSILHEYGTNRNNGFINFVRGGSYDGGFLQFGTLGQTRMTIASSGNVGIGTGTPQTIFEIVNANGNGGLSVSAINLDPANSFDLTFLKNTGRLLLGWNRSGSYGEQSLISNRGAGGKGGFAFYDYDNAGVMTHLMTIDGTGNVGIGTENPTCKLEVGGQSKISVQGASTPIQALTVEVGSFSTESNAKNSYFFSCRDVGASIDKFIIRGNGNVGIGRTDPYYMLDVAGTVRAREVKVNLNTGADFVFEKDYNLMPLNELSRFVNENKHLPDIATAAEMTAADTDLGEMQVKLLQKVEELTLYIIQQNEEIQSLKSEITNLKTQKQEALK
jgi:hypothetical protein